MSQVPPTNQPAATPTPVPTPTPAPAAAKPEAKPAPPEPATQASSVDEGTVIAHLVDLAGYAASKATLTGDDPRIVAVLNAATAEVQKANILPDLLRLMHSGNVNPAAPQTLAEHREDQRRDFEQQFRADLMSRCNQNRDMQQQAMNLMLQLLAQQITPATPATAEVPKAERNQ